MSELTHADMILASKILVGPALILLALMLRQDIPKWIEYRRQQKASSEPEPITGTTTRHKALSRADDDDDA